MQWDVGCSLKQDKGYEDYLRKKSMAQFSYQMSCVAPAACPDSGPRFSECRSYAPAGYRIPQETQLWQQKMTRGRENTERRPQTVSAGTSAYQGSASGALSTRTLDTDTALKFSEPVRGFCQRTLMENVSDRMEFLDGFVPKIESFQPGGVTSRCNKLAYHKNINNCFVPSAPIPPPLVCATGVFKPGSMCS